MIRLTAVTRRFQVGEQEVLALNAIDLQVQRGEYLSIMGPSGSGKSTLLNMIGLLDRPTRGTYELDGEDVTRLSDEAQAKVRLEKIGFVFQFFHLIPSLTASENVAVPMEIVGVSNAKDRAAALLEADHDTLARMTALASAVQRLNYVHWVIQRSPV